MPDGEEGDERLEKMLSSFGEEFTAKERLFVIFYTSPTSKTCGKVNQSGMKAGGAWKAYGSWALQQPHVRKKVDELLNVYSLNEIEDIFREDIKFCKQVLDCDRTSFKKDFEVDMGEKGSFNVIEDKEINELNTNQKKMVAGFEYDKNGHAHYNIETRASARQALLTYHKLLSQNRKDAGENKTETVVTLEAIKDKAIAKVSIIQHNNEEAEAAGNFIESMADIDEEA
ncbi:MAG: hypothetical protein J6O99_06610 [Methanobrevibacter sp.]|nr:hypothetical protein [Methanobrevibacter sp.]